MHATGRIDRYAKRVFQGFSIGMAAVLVVYAVAVIVNRRDQLGPLFVQSSWDMVWPFLAGALIPCMQLLVLAVWFAYLASGERVIKRRLSACTAVAGIAFAVTAVLSFAVTLGVTDAVFPRHGEAIALMMTDYFDIQSIMIALVLFALALVFRRAYALQEDNDSIL